MKVNVCSSNMLLLFEVYFHFPSSFCCLMCVLEWKGRNIFFPFDIIKIRVTKPVWSNNINNKGLDEHICFNLLTTQFPLCCLHFNHILEEIGIAKCKIKGNLLINLYHSIWLLPGTKSNYRSKENPNQMLYNYFDISIIWLPIRHLPYSVVSVIPYSLKSYFSGWDCI